MGWADFYRRRDAIDLVLARTRRNEPVDDIADAVFGGPERLALALQYKWSQHLHGHVAVAVADAEHAPDVDHVAAVASAWRTAARRQPELRRLLDGYARTAGPELTEALRTEQRMLAYAAGLADPGEPAAETARIGAAFLALVRSTPERPIRHPNPVEQLLRRLVASS